MHFLSFTDISMVIYHYGAIAARGSEGVNIFCSECIFLNMIWKVRPTWHLMGWLYGFENTTTTNHYVDLG